MLIPGCGKKEPEKITDESNLISLLPENTSGVISINFEKLSALKFFDKIIKEEKQKKEKKTGEMFENYDDFVQKTGIDLQKDVFSVAIATMGKIGDPKEEDPDAVAVAKLNYDKDKILALLREQGTKFKEKAYRGVPVYTFKNDKCKVMMFSFITENITAIGVPGGVKKVIDLSRGTGKSVLDNTGMNPFVKELKSDAIISFVFESPEEARKVEKDKKAGKFKMDLSKVEAALGFVDYGEKAWHGEIRLISHNKEENQRLVSALNGLKLIFSAADPEIEEMVNNINISASADEVKMEIFFSDEFLERLKKKIEEKNKCKKT